MPFDLQRTYDLLYDFNFGELFIDVLGWVQPSTQEAVSLDVEGQIYYYPSSVTLRNMK